MPRVVQPIQTVYAYDVYGLDISGHPWLMQKAVHERSDCPALKGASGHDIRGRARTRWLLGDGDR
jgi:hypothetical protein